MPGNLQQSLLSKLRRRPAGRKTPQKAPKAYYAYLSRRIEEKPEARFAKLKRFLGVLKMLRIYNLLIL